MDTYQWSIGFRNNLGKLIVLILLIPAVSAALELAWSNAPAARPSDLRTVIVSSTNRVISMSEIHDVLINFGLQPNPNQPANTYINVYNLVPIRVEQFPPLESWPVYAVLPYGSSRFTITNSSDRWRMFQMYNTNLATGKRSTWGSTLP